MWPLVRNQLPPSDKFPVYSDLTPWRALFRTPGTLFPNYPSRLLHPPLRTLQPIALPNLHLREQDLPLYLVLVRSSEMAPPLHLRIREADHCGPTLVRRGRSHRRNPLPTVRLPHPQSALLNRLPIPHRNHRSRQRCHPVFTEARTWQTRKGATAKPLQPVEGLVGICPVLPAGIGMRTGWLTNQRNLSR